MRTTNIEATGKSFQGKNICRFKKPLGFFCLFAEMRKQKFLGPEKSS